MTHMRWKNLRLGTTYNITETKLTPKAGAHPQHRVDGHAPFIYKEVTTSQNSRLYIEQGLFWTILYYINQILTHWYLYQ